MSREITRWIPDDMQAVVTERKHHLDAAAEVVAHRRKLAEQSARVEAFEGVDEGTVERLDGVDPPVQLQKTVDELEAVLDQMTETRQAIDTGEEEERDILYRRKMTLVVLVIVSVLLVAGALFVLL